jgi:hypothetical protein
MRIDRAWRVVGTLLASLALAGCSWSHPIVVVNASDGALDVAVDALAADRWLRGDSLYVASLERFEAGKVGPEDWRGIPMVGDPDAPAAVDSAASNAMVTLRVPPRTVLRIGSALNCRPRFDRCDAVGIVSLSLQGLHGSRTLEGAALRQAFTFHQNTFALRYP